MVTAMAQGERCFEAMSHARRTPSSRTHTHTSADCYRTQQRLMKPDNTNEARTHTHTETHSEVQTTQDDTGERSEMQQMVRLGRRSVAM